MPAPSEPGFDGFGPQALGFLKALAFHQDKVWFEENRATYEADLRKPLEKLLAALTADYARRGLPLRGDARSIFRLHRDIRFAKDKRPYKMNAGAVLTRDGTRKAQGLVYIHLDPEGCFLAAGFWQPDPPALAKLRRHIVRHADEYREVRHALERDGLTIGGDQLSRLPKGFESVQDPDLSADLRRTSLILREPLPPAALAEPGLPAHIIGFTCKAEPLLRFGWHALAEPDAP